MAETCTDPEGCDAPAGPSGLCKKHYQRKWYREHKGKGATKQAKPAPAKAMRAKRAATPAPDWTSMDGIPDMTTMPTAWVIAAHREYLRRRADAQALLAEEG